MIDRRSFLERLGITGGALIAAGSSWGCADAEQPMPETRGAGSTGESPAPLRILILGGTGFIGPHQVEYARSRGHTLTLFNRGRTNTGLFPNVERLVGDRNGDVTALEGREWDVVLDNSGYEPQQVKATAELLQPNTRRYLFISTQAVYADRSIVGQEETGALGITGVPKSGWDGYGPLKALCEEVAHAALGDQLTIVRPGVVVGPGDGTDRFTYWVVRTDRGGDVMAPGDPNDPVQFIDVRDATEFMLHLLEQDIAGTFNVTGPAEVLTFGSMLDVMTDVSASDAQPTWVDQAFMDENDASLPLWRAPSGATEGFNRMNAGRAQAAGLTYRPLNVTVRDTLEWAKTEPSQRWSEMRVGLTGEREAELLRAWRDSRV